MTDRRSAKNDPRGWMAALLFVTAAIYSRSLGNQFIFDDRRQILGNRYIGDWSFIWRSFVNDLWWFQDPAHLPHSPYYRPLHDLWLALNFHLFGFNPVGWHAALIPLHLLMVWLVYAVSARLAGNRWTGLAAAAIFALTPIDAEVVAWPAAVATLLSAVFELAAFAAYLKPSNRRQIWPLALFGCALLSYECAAVFPALVAAHAFLFPEFADLTPCPPSPSGKGERKVESSPLSLAGRVRGGVYLRARAAFAAALPYALVLAAYLGVRYLVLGFVLGPGRGIAAIGTALTIPGALVTYAELLAMPWRAGPMHPLAIVRSAANAGFYIPALEIAALASAAFLALRNHPHRRLYLFCAAWFAIALAPVLDVGRLMAGRFIQDRYLYLPSVGCYLIVADLAIGLARRTEWRRKIVAAGAFAIVAGLALSLFSVQHFWHDEAAASMRCIAEAPGLEACHSRFGAALMERGEYAQARDQFRTALAIAPGNGIDLFDLGLADDRLGARRAAVREMADGLAQISNPPARSYARLALAADAIGDSKTADAALARAESLPGGAEIAAAARAQIRARHDARERREPP
ncbi:MAG: hypothetical protein ACREQI_13520 [Candidatus Binataceae bacterium]